MAKPKGGKGKGKGITAVPLAPQMISAADIVKEVNSLLKTDAVMLGADAEEELTVKFIPFKSLKLTNIFAGGVAKGRITEFYGPTGSGKTTACYELVGKDMQENPTSMWGWYETENSFDPVEAQKYGIDLKRLVIWKMDENGAENGLDVLYALIAKGNFTGMVINSVAGLTPKKEFDNLMGKEDMGTMAKMMSKLMRKITGVVGKKGTACIFINQVRDKISLFGGTVTPGGRALAFFASQRCEFRKVKIEQGDGVNAQDFVKLNAKMVKNRLNHKGNPYVETSLFGRYGHGTDITMEIIELAVQQGLIEKKAGGNYRYVNLKGEEMKWRGNANLLAYVDENKDMADEIAERINANIIKSDNLSDEELKQLEQYNADVDAEISQHLDEEVAADTAEA